MIILIRNLIYIEKLNHISQVGGGKQTENIQSFVFLTRRSFFNAPYMPLICQLVLPDRQRDVVTMTTIKENPILKLRELTTSSSLPFELFVLNHVFQFHLPFTSAQ